MKLWSGLLVSLIAAGALVAPAAAQNVVKPAIVYCDRRQVRQILQRRREPRRQEVQQGDRHRHRRVRAHQRDPVRAGASAFCPTGAGSDRRRRLLPGRGAREGRQGIPQRPLHHHRQRGDAAQRAVRHVQGAGGLVPGRRAGGAGVQERQGRLRRRHGHPADPPLPVRLRAGHQVRQPQGRADRQHDRHDAGRLERSGPRRRARQGPVRPRRRRRLCRGGLDRHRRAAGRQGSRQARDRRRFQPEPPASRHDADLDAEAGRSRGLQQLQGGAGRQAGRAASRCSA